MPRKIVRVGENPQWRQTVYQGSIVMRSVVSVMKQLKNDEEGASLIEYTVLLAIILIAVIAIIAGVGGWILNKWTNLNAALS